MRPEHRSILHGMFAVSLFVLVAKLAGAAKELVVAWRYGVSGEVDAYLFVVNLLTLPVSVWFSVLTVILIPLAARIRHEAPQELPGFWAELSGFTLIIGVALGAVSLFGLPGLVRGAWLSLPERTATLAIEMTPVLAWLVPVGLLVALYSTWIMSSGRHTNSLLEGVPAVAVACGVLLAHGVGPLMWGTLAGTVVQLAILGALVKERDARVLPAFHQSSPYWRPFWRGFGVMIIGQAVFSVTAVVDQFFAAGLGEGAISAMGYAGRMLALALGLVATAVTRATLPVFSQSHVTAAADVRRIAVRWGSLLAAAGVAVVGVGWILAPWGVQVLFQRGTFTAGDTDTVAHLLRLGLLQVPFYFASLVFVSLHSSHGRYKLLLLSGLLGLSTKVIANYLLLPTLGLGALMLSTAVAYAANTALLVGARAR